MDKDEITLLLHVLIRGFSKHLGIVRRINALAWLSGIYILFATSINCSGNKKYDAGDEPQLCVAIHDSDKTLAHVLDRYLYYIEDDRPAETKFQLLKNWLEGQKCVITAEVYQGYIRTEPPLKLILITFRGESEQIIGKLVNLSVEGNKIQVERIKNQ